MTTKKWEKWQIFVTLIFENYAYKIFMNSKIQLF